LDVRLSTAVVSVGGERVVSVGIEEGVLYRVGTIGVEGNEMVTSEQILREFEFRGGDVFNPAQLEEGKKRLYGTGCFERVNPVMTTSPGVVDLLVQVRERRQRFVKGGAGYGTETKERLSLGFEDQSFLGRAWRMEAQYTLSGFATQPEKFETRTVESSLINPFFLGTRWEGRLSLSRSFKFREAYDSSENEIRSGIERRLNSSLSLRFTQRWQGTRLSRVSPEAVTASENSVDAVGVSLRFDNTDEPFLPRQGWRAFGAVEEGLRIFSTDVGFHKMETRFGRFETLESGWTFFGGGQGGILFPASGDKAEAIPIQERFFLGGGNSVRGYSERSLGPKDSNGNPLGGALYVVGNFEIRHPLYKKLFGVVFFDVGNLFDYSPGDRNPQGHISGLRESTGLGVRFHSPVGAIRLEGGYQLNPEGSTRFRDRTAVHFSLGEVF